MKALQVKRIPIFRRMCMPLSELEEYYRLRRKARFEQGKRVFASRYEAIRDLDQYQNYAYETATHLLTQRGRQFMAVEESGVKKGDCVNMCLSYTPEAVCLVLACSKIGALANFINPLFTTGQKITRLNEAASKITIILDAMFTYMKDAVKEIDTDKIVILPAISSLPFFIRKVVELKSQASEDLNDFYANDKRYFSWDSFVKDIIKYKPNMTVVATSLWLGLIKAKECENLDLSNMKYPITGGNGFCF